MTRTALPTSWERAEIGSICDLVNGRAFKTSDWSQTGMPIIRIQNLNNPSAKFNYFDEELADHHEVREGDLLFAWSGTPGTSFGAHMWKGADGALNQHIFKVVFDEQSVSKPYLRYAINQKLDELIAGAQGGVGLRHVTKSKFQKTEIAFPAFAEQKQIANKLDELLAQVDSIKARLDAIPAILKRFRQTVLAAAVSGRLTEDWRGESSYQESDGLNVPTSWHIVTVGDIAQVKGGKRLPKGKSLVSFNTGFPYIRAGQLKDGTVNPTDQLYLTPEVQESISRYIVEKGDVYITIVGACIGDAGVIPEAYHLANLTENAAKLCCLDNSVSSDFLSYWLRSEYLQELVQLEIRSGAQGKLALKRIKTLPFPMPSIEEQQELVSRIAQFISFGEQVEQRLTEAQTRINQLTQSILAKAFRGELTADWREQHPELISGENSAEALLAQIQAARAKLEPKKRARRKKVAST